MAVRFRRTDSGMGFILIAGSKWFCEKTGKHMLGCILIAPMGERLLSDVWFDSAHACLILRRVSVKIEDILPKNYICHFHDCRYNAFGCCTDEENREKCLEIVKMVLCLEEKDD